MNKNTGCAISIWSMEILNNSDNSQYISESFYFFLLSLPFYNLSQLIFENNIDEVSAVIGETKASSFFGIFHHFGQRLKRYRYHFGSNVVFEFLYGIWLVGINFTPQKSARKKSGGVKSGDLGGQSISRDVWCWKKAILTGHQDFRIWFHRNSFCRDFWRVKFMPTSQIPYKSSETTFEPKWQRYRSRRWPMWWKMPKKELAFVSPITAVTSSILLSETSWDKL